MKNKINLVELLKDCPSGMELDCTMFDNVYLERVDKNLEYPIVIRVGKTDIKRLTKEGCWNKYSNAKCVIFPKGRTSWEGFQRPFIEGDIIVDKQGSIAIYKQVHKSYEEPCVDFHCRIYHGNENLFHTNIIKGSLEHCGEIDSARFATEDEKLKLFQAIEDNGYKWNSETNTLEESIVPKFKVGDVIRLKRGFQKYKVTKVTSKYYSAKAPGCVGLFSIKDQDDFILIPNKSDNKILKHFENTTREEEIKEASINYTRKNRLNVFDEDEYSVVMRELDRNKTFEDGARWADKTMIEKACEWLNMNIIDYITEGSRDGISLENQKQLIEDFRKAMKMEE